jgi:hypothetical protein
MKVSWVEEAMHDAQKQEALRIKVSSKMGPCHLAGIYFVSEGEVVVVELVWEAETLPVWEIDLLPSDGG